MNVFDFVRRRGVLWQRLEDLLRELERRRYRSLSADEIRDLGYLYRAVAGDLAFLREHDGPEDMQWVLNHLVARAHNAIYVRPRHSWADVWRFFAAGVPRVCRANLAPIAVAAGVFATAILFGFAVVLADEHAAQLLVSDQILEYVEDGRLWMHDVFDVMPAGYAATRIAANNITVTVVAFALGITAGLGTLYVLVLNGLIIGAVLGLCARHDLLAPMVVFMLPHGVIELAALCIAAGAGLVLGSALVDPGDHPRLEALRLRGADAIRIALGMVPVLLFAGLTESYISPMTSLPAWSRVLYGLAAGALLFLYLGFAGRTGEADERES